MKRITLLLLALLIVSFAMADRISSEQALKNVVSFFNQGSTSQRRVAGKISEYKLALSSEGYYIFTGTAGNGYIIAAANDEMTSTVLGYSDDGTFDAQSIPKNMKWWLSEYDRAAQWLAANPGKHLPVKKTERANIEPLLTSLWSQDSPYYDLCPEIDGQRCPVGCVATAVAQILYYHKWPLTGEGSHSYEWNDSTLSADFSQSTYDWDAMTDTYGDNSSEAARAAVAKLLRDVGISCEIDYAVDGSAGDNKNVVYALHNYFKYSREACLYDRSYYTTDEWEQMVYESLERNEPVYYSGTGSGGHAFVCDGYNDGYYHINWGWAGMSNGFFLLSALNPYEQGWGGSANGYCAYQAMIANIRPDRDGSSKTIAYMNSEKDFKLKYNPSEYGDYTMSGGFWNETLETINTMVGLEFVDSLGNSEFRFEYDAVDLDANTGWSEFSVSKDIFPTENGTYKVYPAYYDGNNNTNNRLHTNTYCTGYCMVTINDGKIKIVQPTYGGKMTCTKISYNKLYAGKYSNVTCTFKNVGTERYSNIVLAGIYDYDSAEWASSVWSFADLEPGASCDLSFNMKVPSETDHTCGIYVYDAEDYLCGENITVNEIPTGKFAGVLTSEPVCTVDQKNNVSITCDFSCTSGYEDELIVWFYDQDGYYINEYLQNGYQLAEGDNVTLTFSGNVSSLEPETTYYYDVEGYLNNYYSFKYGNTAYFQFTTPKEDDGTFIQSVEADRTDAPLYNLQGQQIVSPVKGQIYIQNGKKVME